MSRVTMDLIRQATAHEDAKAAESDVFAENLKNGVPKKPAVKKPAAKRTARKRTKAKR